MAIGKTEKYLMPDGSIVFLNGLPLVTVDPITGKRWYGIRDIREERIVRKTGVRMEQTDDR